MANRLWLIATVESFGAPNVLNNFPTSKLGDGGILKRCEKNAANGNNHSRVAFAAIIIKSKGYTVDMSLY